MDQGGGTKLDRRSGIGIAPRKIEINNFNTGS